MAQKIPLFLAEDEENTPSMASQRGFMDLNDPLDRQYYLTCSTFPLARASIYQIYRVDSQLFDFTKRS